MPFPESPPGADHQSHDRLLITRLAARDLPETAQPAAEALRAGCPECASLARDLGFISRATAALPAPRRPRDFRLTPGQAQQARGSIVRRLMQRLAAPRLGVLQPLGAAAVAIGFVLVVVGMGLPSMVGGTPAAGGPEAYSAADPSGQAAVPDANTHAESVAGSQAPSTAAAPEAPGTDVPAGAAASPVRGIAGGGNDSEAAGGGRAGSGEPDAVADPSDDTEGLAYPFDSPAPPRLSSIDAADDKLAQGRGGTPAGAGMVVIGLLIGLAGLILIILRVLSQRVGRDPAIR